MGKRLTPKESWLEAGLGSSPDWEDSPRNDYSDSDRRKAAEFTKDIKLRIARVKNLRDLLELLFILPPAARRTFWIVEQQTGRISQHRYVPQKPPVDVSRMKLIASLKGRVTKAIIRFESALRDIYHQRQRALSFLRTIEEMSRRDHGGRIGEGDASAIRNWLERYLSETEPWMENPYTVPLD